MRRVMTCLALLGILLIPPLISGCESANDYAVTTNTTAISTTTGATGGAVLMNAADSYDTASGIIADATPEYLSTINRLRAGKDAMDVGVHPTDGQMAVQSEYSFYCDVHAGTCLTAAPTIWAYLTGIRRTFTDHGTIMRC